MKKSSPLLLAILVLLIGIVSAILAASHIRKQNAAELERRFAQLSDRIVSRVVSRIQTYEYGLRGARGAVVAAGGAEITRLRFRQYAETREIDREFPGARGYGFIRRVPADGESAFLSAVRRDAMPDFEIRQLSAHVADRFVIQYIEPVERNREAVGLDIASQSSRRLAALRAARTGEPTLTAPITLVQAEQKPQRGFLLLLPVYASGAPLSSPEARWQALIGWAYTPLVIDEVLHGVDLFGDQAALRLYDIEYAEAPQGFYASAGAGAPLADNLLRKTTVDLYGRQWQVEVSAMPAFVAALNQRSPTSVAVAIVAGTMLLAGLFFYYLLAAQRRLSASLAAERSAAIAGREAEQRRIVRRFQLATDAAGLGVCEFAPQTGVITLDARCAQIYGHPAGEPIARDAWLAHVHPDDRARVEVAMREALYGAHPLDERYRVVLPSGELRWVRAHGATQTNEDGQLRLVGIHQDVTEQTLNSQSLERNERFLAALADNLPSMVAHFDRHLRCTFANRALAALLRRSAAEVVGEAFEAVMGAPFVGDARSRIASVLAGEAQRFEVTLAGDGDASRHLWVHYIPDLDAQGVAGFYAIIYDVSEVRVAERRLEALNRELERQRSIAEAASQAKGRFVANMSHEIRTPMNAILGLAYLLDKGELTPPVRESVRKIQRAGQLLLGILNDILDFSKIEANRLELGSEPFSLQELLDDLAGVAAMSVGKQGVEVIVGPAPQGIDWLVGDALRLRQVMTNLVSNAIKFTEHGEVDIEVAIVRRQADRVGLEFSVRDTGIGIDADKLQEIFSPFTQADVTTTRRFGGTGLGLAISRRLVELMGGTLDVQSAPGAGSRFAFQLELPRAPEVSAGRPVEQRLRALVADDHPLAREALSVAARALGWEVDAVDSGEAAERKVLAAAAQGVFYDVLILDWRMPGLDGLAAASRIRDVLTDEQPPVILMVTAAEREALLAEARETQIDGVITKPVTCSALLDAYLQVVGTQAQDSRVHRPEGAAAQTRRLTGRHLLVVDDSEINREVALSILEAEGASVQLAGDGEEALRVLTQAERWPDVVLMDIQMPVLDGYAATRRIRALPGGDRLPVVALTAGAFRDQHDAAVAAGMNGFVTKPFQPDTLIETLMKLLSESVPQAERSAAVIPVAVEPSGLPLFDEAAALRTWREPGLYRQYLQHFIDEHAADPQRIASLLAQGDVAAASEAAHRLGGAAVALALGRLTEVVRALERQIRSGSAGDGADATLASTMTVTLAAIQAYLAVGAALSAEAVDRLRAALDTDNPGTVDAVLAELRPQLPAELLAKLQGCLADYDFRAAERVVDALAAARAAPVHAASGHAAP